MPPFDLSKLLQEIDRLSSAERQVARALAAGYPFAGLKGVRHLAKAAGVSDPTVVRFARRLGYDGYPAFQRAIVQAMEEAAGGDGKGDAALPPAASQRGAQIPNLKAATLAWQRAVGHLQSLPRWFDEHRARECIALLSDPRKRVLAMGGVWSQPLAALFIYLLNHLRPNVALLHDSQIPVMDQIFDVGDEVVLVVLDFDLYQRNVAVAARAIKDAGAKVILFTDETLSPIADFASFVFTVPVDIGARQISTIAIATALELLLAEIAESMGPGIEARISKIQKMRQAVDQLSPQRFISRP